MKALVYIVCVAVAAMVQTAISMSGVQLGGLPVVLLYGTALAVATAACKAIQRRKTRPAIPKERWYTCPRCGQLVPEGKPCDCESLSPQPGEKLCGTPFIQAGQTPPGVETEQPKPGKRLLCWWYAPASLATVSPCSRQRGMTWQRRMRNCAPGFPRYPLKRRNCKKK